MNWRVPLADLSYEEDEEQAVLKVLRNRWLTMGAVTQEFEEKFMQYTGAKHAIAVTNGTAALHLACQSLGIGPGDEVIAPSLSFVATANAVLYTGSDVQFADIRSLQDLTIDPQSVSQLVSSRTRAIIVMHYAGFPCDMGKIMDIARMYKLSIIEDAAHASGAWLNGHHLGTIGDIGCFSFFSNKNLATGEGGMIVTNRDDIAEKIRLLRSHGMTNPTLTRYLGHAYSYDVVELGYNYRIDEIRSGLGIQQLKKLTANNARREDITRTYWSALMDSFYDKNRNGLSNLPHSGIILPFSHIEFKSSLQPAYHIFPLLLPAEMDRSEFINHLHKAGIQTSIHYPPIHMFQFYRQRQLKKHFNGQVGLSKTLPLTEQVASRQVTLPLYPGMSNEQVNYVIETTIQALDQLKRNNHASG